MSHSILLVGRVGEDILTVGVAAGKVHGTCILYKYKSTGNRQPLSLNTFYASSSQCGEWKISREYLTLAGICTVKKVSWD